MVLRSEWPTPTPNVDTVEVEEMQQTDTIVDIVSIDSIIEQLSDRSLLVINEPEPEPEQERDVQEAQEVEPSSTKENIDEVVPVEEPRATEVLVEKDVPNNDPESTNQQKSPDLNTNSYRNNLAPTRQKPTKVSESRLFRDQKGRLPWPIANGVVTDGFGLRKNAEARGLRKENYGVDMLGKGGSLVRAVHDGIVLMAVQQPPYDNIVTVKHGDYTTAYFFLSTTNVNVGDFVKRGSIIGNLKRNVNQADFHFEIWDNQSRVNPEVWLQNQ